MEMVIAKGGSVKTGFIKKRKRCWQLYLLMIIPVVYLLIFKYYPMLGIQIAFKDYIVTKGIWGSPWAGLKHFSNFFNSYQFWRVIWNTLSLSIYSLVVGFFMPIIFALGLNYITSNRYKKIIQTVTYAPHFISTVVMVGIVMQFLSPRTGLVNILLENLGLNQINFLGEAKNFRHIYVWSGIWQNLGYSSIIYIAALSNISPSLHEAAVVDGANKLQRMWHIDIPGIMPTAVILLIMSTGGILSVGFEKVLLLQNSLNLETSEVIGTYVYKAGLKAALPMFSYSSAIGFFQSIVGLVLLVTVNKIANNVSETSLW